MAESLPSEGNPVDSSSGASPATTLSSPTAVVHLEYNITDPPPKPSAAWTRFICISDTHSRRFPVPDGDVLLHSGDLTAAGTYSDFHSTMEWLVDLPHPKKIIIAGNHDLPLDDHDDWYDNNFHRWHSTQKQNIGLIQDLVQGHKAMRAGIVYLEDETHEFQVKGGGKTWSVYGSPVGSSSAHLRTAYPIATYVLCLQWSPHFYNWAFNYQRGEEAESESLLVNLGLSEDGHITHSWSTV
ncbi:hypothetical protein AcW1_005006 [Taiwanofungus camphoratus]|nr:hypothetical protein AcV7_002853 [Antrodia cinnamomea]KAI0960510.1 hypothetical protein AcW1_005006 [Antrodia cinnamomea]